MDLDIEMDDAVHTAHDAPIADFGGDDILQTEELEEPGEVADDEPTTTNNEAITLVPNKVHIRGVETLHTNDIKAYVKSHFGGVDRVEWIDDSSANLLFSSELIAHDAIVALSTVEIADPTALAAGESLPAKPVEGKPEISLQVRFAVQSDKKEAGAALRSRYYLLHPEHDPEERRRRHGDNRSRYRDREGDYHRSGPRRRRDSDDEVETFEASMYDDAPRASRRKSETDEPPRSYTRENQGKELFGNRRSGRDRSASPMRDIDGDNSMGERASSARNRTKARSIKGRLSSDNRSKELFPTKGSGDGGRRLDELERAIGSARLKEEDRPKIVAIPDAPKSGAFNIRGLANQRIEDAGFTIKGAASGASAKELFPDRFGGGNVGKELFDGSRSKRRQKAEDLFS
ncbi:Fc.00g006010.m01.CDS01 [Cosmosporella sp. VM-42]